MSAVACLLAPMLTCGTDDIALWGSCNALESFEVWGIGVFIYGWEQTFQNSKLLKGNLFIHGRRFNKYFDWITEGGFKRSPQTGQSMWPSRLRVSNLHGLLLELVEVVLAKVLERRLRRREASNWSNSSRRESKTSRGKALISPTCFGSLGLENILLAVSMQFRLVLHKCYCWFSSCLWCLWLGFSGTLGYDMIIMWTILIKNFGMIIAIS